MILVLLELLLHSPIQHKLISVHNGLDLSASDTKLKG